MSTKIDQDFIKTVWQHYKTCGRHTLPWRKTTNPYRIVVSEIMLQQTQVERVLPKYRAFVKQWGSARALARAPLAQVLIAWQGLGYNRRAKLLHRCAQAVVNEHQGKWPHTYEALQQLPGIGPYTAGAVMAFTYNQPIPIIETNIRTVFLHHFFQDQTDVPEADILLLTEVYLDQSNPREWYWALMDYGAYLKKTHGNLNHRAKSYTKQSKFVGSDRQIRGAIVRALSSNVHTLQSLTTQLAEFTPERIRAQLDALVGEGLVTKERTQYQLPQ